MSTPSMASLGRNPRFKLLLIALCFPIYMALVMPGSYLAGMHHPAPNNLAVQVVGTDQRAVALAAQLDSQQGHAFDVTRVDDLDTARHDLRDLTSRAAYVPATGDLYVAGSGGVSDTKAAQALFEKVAAQQHATVHVHDIAPMPTRDAGGMGMVYIGLATMMSGFLAATVIAMAAPGLGTRGHLGAIALMAVVGAITTCFVAYSVYGVYLTRLPEVVAVAALGALAAGLFHYGGYRLVGPAMTLVTTTVMVLFGLPASGGPVPVGMLNDFYQWLHPLLPLPAVLEGLRRVIYFGGEGLSRNLATLAAWVVLGGWLLFMGRLKDANAGAHAAAPSTNAAAPAVEPVEPVAATEGTVVAEPATAAPRPSSPEADAPVVTATTSTN